jgi:hypothetical protein
MRLSPIRVSGSIAILALVAACGDDAPGGTGGGGGDDPGGGGAPAAEGGGGAAAEGGGGSAASGGALCPDGLSDTGATDPVVVECPAESAAGEACCSSDELYCLSLRLPDEGGNLYTKVLFTCEGDAYGAGETLPGCEAASLDELEALDGTACTDEPPCDITTGDADPRIAICSGGTWHVF